MQLSKADNDEIMLLLRESFLKSFEKKKIIIERSLKNQTIDGIRTIAHELRGEGGMIGNKKISVLGGLIEDRVNEKNINWGQVGIMCDQLFTIISEMEGSIVGNTE